MVATMTTRPRIRRNGLTPRTNSSSAHTKRATSANTRSTSRVPPFGLKKCKARDRTMNTDRETFGHWATVMRPVRRFSSIQRTARRTTPYSGSVDSAVVTDQPWPIPASRACRVNSTAHHRPTFANRSRCRRALRARSPGLYFGTDGETFRLGRAVSTAQTGGCHLQPQRERLLWTR